jgi:hypothetical protein
VRIPSLYRGDDHTFFFFSFEDLLMRQPQPTQAFAVPTSQTRLLESPLSAPLYNALPLPNLPASAVNAGPGWAGFAQGFSLPTDQRTWGLRLDHYFTDKLIGFFRYNLAPSHQTLEEYGMPLTQFQFAANTVMLTAGVTESISPALVNDLRANFSSQYVDGMQGFLSANGAKPFPVSLLFPQGESPQTSEIWLNEEYDSMPPYIPGIQLGFMGASRSRQIQAVDQLSYTRGTHQFRFGLDYRMLNLLYTPPRTSTIYDFSDLHDGLVGYLEEWIQPNLAWRDPALSLYAQDTWHALRNFTVTFGLRWEIEPAPHATNSDVTVYNLPNLADLSSLSPAPRGAPFYPTQYTNLAPRIGLAWQMLNRGERKTVLRAGTGLFYDTAQSGFPQVGSLPSSENTQYNLPLNAFSIGAPLDSNTFAGVPVVAAHGYTLPRTWEWNVTVEQSLGRQTFSLAYTGAIGRRLLGNVGGYIAASDSYLPILDNGFSSSYHALQLQFNRRVGKRVQALASYTWSHSIDNLSDQAGSNLDSLSTDALLYPNLNRGDSDFDIRQSLHGALFVALPAPHSGPASVLLRKWTASTIFFARTALPTNLLIFNWNTELRPDLVPGQPLYLYGSGYPGGKSFNGAAFTTPPYGALEGDLGRNALRGFGAWQADLALHREFRLTEHTTMQFRGEAFNVLNHPNFANPYAYRNGPQGDVASGTPNWNISQASLAGGLSPIGALGELNRLFQVGGPRSLQLALRLTF